MCGPAKFGIDKNSRLWYFIPSVNIMNYVRNINLLGIIGIIIITPGRGGL